MLYRFDSRLVVVVCDLALLGAAFLAALILAPYIEPDFSLLFLGAVAFACWRWGVLAGVVATATSLCALAYLSHPLHWASALPNWPFATRQVLFAATAGLMVRLISRLRKAEHRLRLLLDAQRAAAELARSSPGNVRERIKIG